MFLYRVRFNAEVKTNGFVQRSRSHSKVTTPGFGQSLGQNAVVGPSGITVAIIMIPEGQAPWTILLLLAAPPFDNTGIGDAIPAAHGRGRI